MKAIIIEDEKPAARKLKRMLEQLEIDVLAVLHSVENAISWLKENQHPDLGFFDIQLGDGLSFEIFRHIDIKFPLIFTTAFDEYAIKAFKLNSVDYLLKPIDEDELKDAIDKFERIYKSNDRFIESSQLKSIISNLSQKSYKTRFSIKIGQKFKLISSKDIACFYSENKGTYLSIKGEHSYLIDEPLDQIETVVDPNVFYRVNRKFIVNINSIKEMYAYSNSRLKIILEGSKNYDIIVSRERVKAFKKWVG